MKTILVIFSTLFFTFDLSAQTTFTYDNQRNTITMEQGDECITVLPPVNDEACDAIPITVDATCNSDDLSNENAYGQYGEPGCTFGAVNSVWFKFVAPPSGKVQVELLAVNGGLDISNARIGVFAVGDCNDFTTYTQITCAFETTPNLSLTPGATYFIQVDGYADDTGSFCIAITQNNDPPVSDCINDDACDAILLPVNATCTTYNYSNECATLQSDEPTCYSNEVNSVWFKFIAPASGKVNVSMKWPGGTLTANDTRVGVYAVSNCNDFSSFMELDCDFGGTKTLDVNPDEVYYVQVDGQLSEVGTFCLEVKECQAPVNDNVINAIPLAVGEGCNGYLFSNVCATAEAEEPGCNTGEINSVWFSFVAPQSGQVRISSHYPGGTLASNDAYIGVFAAQNCNSFDTFNLIFCDRSPTDNLSVTPGLTYYIKVEGAIDETGTFCLEVNDCPAPVNNRACDAIPININENCTEYSFDNYCANADPNEPGCNTGEINSVWFSFVAPASGRVRVSSYYPGGTLDASDAYIGVFSAEDCTDYDTFTLLHCGLSPSDNLNVTPGNTYFIKVDGAIDRTGTFCIEVTDCSPPPNDEACNAVLLNINEQCTEYRFDNYCANEEVSGPGCSTGEVNSVWFKFIAPASGVVEVRSKFPGGSLDAIDTYIGVFSALDCADYGTFSQLFCDRSPSGNLNVVAGETYYVKVDGVIDRKGTFCIEVIETNFTYNYGCTNDDICNAIALDLNESCIFSTNECAGAQENEPAPSCFIGGALNTIWYSFIAPPSGRVSLSDQGSLDIQYAIYTVASCNDFGTANEIWCSRSDAEFIPGLVPGQTYYIQVDGINVYQGEVCLTVEACVEIPTNDLACNARPLTIGENCIAINNSCASFEEDEPYPNCFIGGDLNTVWYSFVAPPSGRINLSDRGDLDLQYAIYSMLSCNDFSTASEIWCSRNDADFIPGLVPGQTYYIQVDGINVYKGEVCLMLEECIDIPANDSVCNAELLTFGANCSFFNNSCASFEEDEPYPNCFIGGDLNTVWYRFVAPLSGQVNLYDQGDLDIQFAVYTIPTCEDLSTAEEIWCSRDNDDFISELIPGQAYYVQVDGINVYKGEVCLTLEDCGNIPINDLACNAQPLTFGENCTFIDNSCASFEDNEPQPNCFIGGDLNTLWYSFIAPFSGRVNLSDLGNLDIQFAIYSIPTCTDFSTATQILCSRDDDELIEGLTPGQTYYIQVDGINVYRGEVCLVLTDPDATDCPPDDELLLSGTEPGAVVYQANQLITSTQNLPELSNVEYIAGERIVLSSGFSAAGIFSARIEACQPTQTLVSQEVPAEGIIGQEQLPLDPFSIDPDGKLKLYPNPAGGLTTLEYVRTQEGNLTIDLVDARGLLVNNVLSDISGKKGAYKMNVDVKDYASGIYFIIVRELDQTFIEKLILVND